ncbi:MAG: IS3 family transposase [Vulcanimicrobiaceae bacterium]
MARFLCAEYPTRLVCLALGVSRATLLRRPQAVDAKFLPVHRVAVRRLSEFECAQALALLHGDRFVDRSPAQVVAVLLDEGRYLCSESTLYRLLREHGEVRERRHQTQHPQYRKPELLATGPNQCWSWDITKLRGPYRGQWYALLVMLDIFSRMVVGWTLVRRANAAIAERFIEQTIQDHHIIPGTLTIHADRGSEMTAQPVCDLLERLAVTRSHSRPQVSDDNPYSESQFKSMKYAGDFPDRFGSFEHARDHTHSFMTHYNTEHRHSGIAMLTPADVHAGRGPEKLARRHAVMSAAFQQNPERFVHGEPKLATLPEAVWINAPMENVQAA